MPVAIQGLRLQTQGGDSKKCSLLSGEETQKRIDRKRRPTDIANNRIPVSVSAMRSLLVTWLPGELRLLQTAGCGGKRTLRSTHREIIPTAIRGLIRLPLWHA